MAVAEQAGSLATALAHARRLLAAEPMLAIEQASEILKVVPGQPEAQRLLSAAYRALGDQLTLSGDSEAADRAYADYIRTSTNDPRLMQAARALCDNQIPVAEHLLRTHLKQFPTDVAAIRMLAEVAARLGRHGDAEKLLSRALELAPSFEAARHNYAIVLFRQQKSADALAEIDRLLESDPQNPSYRNLKAATLARTGEYDAAIALYAQMLKEFPREQRVWLSYGHTLRTAGRQDECIIAYRKCIEFAPSFGEAYWSLANLKTFRFSPADVAAMRKALARADLKDEDRYHLHFSLGKALEDAAEYAPSYSHYDQGNRLRRASVSYKAQDTTAHLERSRALLTREFFAARAGSGAPDADPIFIVGLPRAGSTLIEQILSSHSQVEGTMELADLTMLARELSEQKHKSEGSKYLDKLAGLDGGQLRALGEKYLARTRIQRKSGRPLFIDKMPNNFAHLGMIQLILPNAKIIDARRHPMANCFSAFKQHFARGQTFSYDLGELGRYYRDYVALMAHFDEVLPGRVHRVFYERMVGDTESEIRRLLAYCGLDFEETCLRFNETERAVRTASSEQVRQPIFRDGVEQWRNYEQWLGPLREALGPLCEAYPGVA
ncbi:MAG: sulfotransferase [Micropepsaceae bacterium]